MIYGRPYIAARTISSLLSGTLSSRHFACRSNTPSEDDSPVDYTVHNNASAILGEGRQTNCRPWCLLTVSHGSRGARFVELAGVGFHITGTHHG